MASCKAGEVEAFIQRGTRYPVVLVYGPNGGLANERARLIAHRSVSDPADSFQMVRFEGDDIAGDPLRLADEANTMGLFGGKRAIWIRAGSRNLVPAVQPLLSAPPEDSVVVIEAGDLAARNPLRVAVEGARSGMALPCYADEPGTLAALIDAMMREHGLTMAREAREAVLELVGADRLLTRREIEKLALYASGTGTVTLAAVEAVMADASALALDTVIDAAFTGDLRTLDGGITRLFAEGEDAGMVAGAALRHAMTLHRTRCAMDAGASAESAMGAARIFFKRKTAFQRQLNLWPAHALEGIVGLLREAQATARRHPGLGEAQLARTFLTIATRVARR